MDPLITNGVDPALLRVLDKRGDEREQVPRRKRNPSPGRLSNTADKATWEIQDEPDSNASEEGGRGGLATDEGMKTGEGMKEEEIEETGSESPEHALDDLA